MLPFRTYSWRRWTALGVPALVVALGVLVPLMYLVLRAAEADAEQLQTLVWRTRNLRLLLNTVLLGVGVLALSTVLAFPLAWLTARTQLPGRRLWAVLGVLPLAVPGYVMAFVLLATTGSTGTLAELTGIVTPRLSGYGGALLALSLYLFPYLFLNLRAGLLDLDASLEETARALGYTPWQVFRRVILPQLRPAYFAGALLILLHVLGDFGVVSLMRFETFSYAIYVQYAAAYDRIYAAWLALMLLGLTAIVLALEARQLRGLHLYRTGTGTARPIPLTPLGRARWIAYPFLALLGLVAVVVPVTTVAYWMAAQPLAPMVGDLLETLGASVAAAAPAALLAAGLALPIATLSVRDASPLARGLERVAYLGYATPPLAFALAFIVFTLQAVPLLYQTLALLVIAYALHFLAEGIGPIRTALYQAPPRLEEAARTLGRSPLRAFWEVTFPLLRRGLLVSVAFVFLSAMKELPLTFLLSPPGFQTLALGVWSFANEAMFDHAAPYALTIILFSSAFVLLLLSRERTRPRTSA